MKRLILILLIITPFALSAQDVSKQSEQKKKIEEEIAFIDNQLKAISSKQKANVRQLSLIQQKMANRRLLMAEIDGQIKDTDNKILSKTRAIASLQTELDTLETYYNRLIYNSYKNRDTKVWFMYLLASENIGQGYRRFTYLKNLSATVNNQVAKIKETQTELQKEKEELAEYRAKAEQMRTSKKDEYNKLVSDEAQSKKIVSTLSKNQQQYKRELAQKKKEVDRLNKEIERILSRTVQSQQKDKTKVDYALAGLFEQNKGKLPWPVTTGVVIDKFGTHFHPVYKNLKLPENNGITISTTKNATVHCVFNGVVKQILVMPGYNQCVLVQHGTYFTFYCKLQKVNVKAGQKINTGDVIGTLDDADNTSALHFQIWKGTQKQNPELWLSKK